MAEDARIITIRKLRDEELARERADEAAREAKAKADAEAEAQRRAAEEAERVAAERAKQEAFTAAHQAERAKAEADAARAAALSQQQAAQAEAEKARQAADLQAQRAQQAEAEKADAREKLAKVAGIILSHPGLKLELEGHTDSVGGDEYNLRLSDKRAEAVRDYLVSQGISEDSISARGLGKSEPVASNSTASGRQMNRRVEMVASGDIRNQGILASRLAACPHGRTIEPYGSHSTGPVTPCGECSP